MREDLLFQGWPERAEKHCEAQYEALKSLADRGIIGEAALRETILKSQGSLRRLEELMTGRGVPNHEILLCLSNHYRFPFLEFDENIKAPREVLDRLDPEELKRELWFPLSVGRDGARVVISDPGTPDLARIIAHSLGVFTVKFILALPSDLIRMIEHYLDVNPGFPAAAGRTPLARLRTRLAGERTVMACYRTSLAKARTGLALLRTGVSFIAIALLLFRIFGIGYLSVLQVALLGIGLVMASDGLAWYLPVRKLERLQLDYHAPKATFGTSILWHKPSSESLLLYRSAPVEGAGQLRSRWNRLSPVMKRRFLAIDRTDLAEERTVLASFRTKMARARTGLAFTRTGVSFAGLGIALLRQFPPGPWMIFYGALIVAGVGMFMEGARWYPVARRAGRKSFKAIRKVESSTSIWDFMFRPFSGQIGMDELPPTLSISATLAPGIWGTTGLALERTLIAERRNVKARLRTALARSRTGLSFIRTGTSIFSIGLGLLVYFGLSNIWWTLFDVLLMGLGALAVVDGLYWHVPAERIKNEFPYCFQDVEMSLPDYGKPSASWKTVVFSHEEI
jgi:uncharacterized membrane protein YidH (DUF202 family)